MSRSPTRHMRLRPTHPWTHLGTAVQLRRMGGMKMGLVHPTDESLLFPRRSSSGSSVSLI